MRNDDLAKSLVLEKFATEIADSHGLNSEI